MIYREEFKYICSDYELTEAGRRLSAILPYDSHQTEDCYHIRSLYFDTYDDRLFYENEAGIDDRSKYRIRIYNCSDNRISFEIKQKLHERVKKESCPLSKESCLSFIHGNFPSRAPCDSTVMNRIYLEYAMHRLRPVLIVDYERTAFTFPAGNVRITFDRNISISKQIDGFFDPALPLVPVLEPHTHVLEVKYDELLPDFIAQTLEIGSLQRTSFSKYYLGRQLANSIY